MNRRTFSKLAGLAAVSAFTECSSLSAEPANRYGEKMPPAQHPQVVYWFWHPDTVAGAQYLRDVENMAKNSSFTMAIATSRENIDPPGMGVDFYDFTKMHEPLAQTVRAAHQHGLKIGLQVWEFWALTRVNDPLTKSHPRLAIDQSLALVTEGEVVLDALGHGQYSAASTEGRDRAPYHSEVLKAFAFRKTEDGIYKEDSLTDITHLARAVATDGASVTLEIEASAKLAGFTVYVMVAHYYDYPDLFNEVMTGTFRDLLKRYADIPLDGTGLDEFGYMMLNPKRKQPFRDRFYGHAFATEYLRRTGTTLEQTLFDMRFAPEGKPEVRICAIDRYFDVMRDGPLRVEQAFYKMSKEIFGERCFAGIHNTYHNGLLSDDLWRVGLNWWTVPREYGQSDENWPLPKRMGLIAAHRESITYDQYYGGNLDRFLEKAFREARFGGRTHYLAWNDTRVGRINMTDAVEQGKYAAIEQVEQKIRLLNQFDPPAPKLPVLIVFGMPALINWFPDKSVRSAWDLNGKLGIEEKSQAIWDAGYPCALLSSDLIDNGQIEFDGAGHLVINGHRFDCMVYLYPQYAKETTLRFLERFTQYGGKLMLEGDASRDFDGSDIAGRFAKIAGRATVRGFDVNQLPSLGAQVNPLENGAFMEDGSVVFTNFASWQTNQPEPFSIKLSGREFSGSYIGICALKVDQAGEVDKFSCGSFSELRRDGQVIFSLEQPADAVITRARGGDLHALVAGSNTNKFRIHAQKME